MKLSSWPVGLLIAVATPPVAAAAESVPADPLERTLIALEKQSWVAWQQHDVGFWRRFLSDDHVELNQVVGVTGKRQVIDGIASGACTVSDYALDRFSFRRFGRDTALLVYRAAQTTRCGAFVVPSPVWATSLYQKRRGRWVNVLYGHTPILTPSGD